MIVRKGRRIVGRPRAPLAGGRGGSISLDTAGSGGTAQLLEVEAAPVLDGRITEIPYSRLARRELCQHDAMADVRTLGAAGAGGGPPGGPRRRSPALVLAAAAIAWGVLVMVAATTVPVVTLQDAPATATATAPSSTSSSGESVTPDDTGNHQTFHASPRVTVLRHDGPAGVAIASVPAVVALLVAGLLWVASRRQRTVLVPVAAWALSVVLVLAGIVGFVTILVGAVAVPSGVLLVLACSSARSERLTSPAVPASA